MDERRRPGSKLSALEQRRSAFARLRSEAWKRLKPLKAPAPTVIMDGEVVVPGESGLSDLGALQDALGGGGPG